MDKSRIAIVLLVSFVIALVATSCRRNDEVQPTYDKDKSLSSRVEALTLAAPAEKTMSRDERYKAEFERLAVSANMTVDDTASQVCALCNEIFKLPDKGDSLRLLDQFLEVAIAQEVTKTNYYSRQNWYSKLFYIARGSFGFSQLLRKESFESWDNLFRFLGKYTNEIVSVEKSIPSDWRKWSESEWDRAYYLFGFRQFFKQDIRTMRRAHFPDLSEGLSDAQKADILRRFDELEAYTVSPTNLPFGRKMEVDLSELPVIEVKPEPCSK